MIKLFSRPTTSRCPCKAVWCNLMALRMRLPTQEVLELDLAWRWKALRLCIGCPYRFRSVLKCFSEANACLAAVELALEHNLACPHQGVQCRACLLFSSARVLPRHIYLCHNHTTDLQSKTTSPRLLRQIAVSSLAKPSACDSAGRCYAVGNTAQRLLAVRLRLSGVTCWWHVRCLEAFDADPAAAHSVPRTASLAEWRRSPSRGPRR